MKSWQILRSTIKNGDDQVGVLDFMSVLVNCISLGVLSNVLWDVPYNDLFDTNLRQLRVTK